MSDTIIVNHEYRLRRGELEAIEDVNPRLNRGEPLVYFEPEGGIQMKVGDGERRANDLPYIGINNSSNDIQIDETNLQSQIDTLNLKDDVLSSDIRLANSSIESVSNDVDALSSDFHQFKALIEKKFQVAESLPGVTVSSFGGVKDTGDDNAVDSSEALYKAFTFSMFSSVPLKIDDDYYVDPYKTYGDSFLRLYNTSNQKIYGNGHRIRIKSKSPEEALTFLSIQNCDNIIIDDLYIESTNDQEMQSISKMDSSGNLIKYSYNDLTDSQVEEMKLSVKGCSYEQKQAWELPKSSNITGIRITKSSNVYINNLTSNSLSTCISMQGEVNKDSNDNYMKSKDCFNIKIDGWKSENTLMGLYASASKNVEIQNFNIEMDPINAIEYQHTFYLNYGLKNWYIHDGKANHKIIYQSFKYPLANDETTYITPTIDIRGGKGDSNKDWSNKITLSNVDVESQRPLSNEYRNKDTIYLYSCNFNSWSTSNPMEHSQGHITIRDNYKFNNCNFNLDNLTTAFLCSLEDANIDFNQCNINGFVIEGINTELLMSYSGNFTFFDCDIDWPQHYRDVRGTKNTKNTKFFNCNLNVVGNYAKLMNRCILIFVSPFEQNDFPISEFVNTYIGDNCYMIALTSGATAEGLSIINCTGNSPVLENAPFYWGTYSNMDTLSDSVTVYNSFINGEKISRTDGFIKRI